MRDSSARRAAKRDRRRRRKLKHEAVAAAWRGDAVAFRPGGLSVVLRDRSRLPELEQRYRLTRVRVTADGEVRYRLPPDLSEADRDALAGDLTDLLSDGGRRKLYGGRMPDLSRLKRK
jgi:hypothetical protein